MLGIWGSHSDHFLLVVGAFTLVVFGVPMAIWPIQWARVSAGLRCTDGRRSRVRGIRGNQPVTETYEIAFWAGMAVLALCFWP
jgi:hypothetical protein